MTGECAEHLKRGTALWHELECTSDLSGDAKKTVVKMAAAAY